MWRQRVWRREASVGVREALLGHTVPLTCWSWKCIIQFLYRQPNAGDLQCTHEQMVSPEITQLKAWRYREYNWWINQAKSKDCIRKRKIYVNKRNYSTVQGWHLAFVGKFKHMSKSKKRQFYLKKNFTYRAQTYNTEPYGREAVLTHLGKLKVRHEGLSVKECSEAHRGTKWKPYLQVNV